VTGGSDRTLTVSDCPGAIGPRGSLKEKTAVAGRDAGCVIADVPVLLGEGRRPDLYRGLAANGSRGRVEAIETILDATGGRDGFKSKPLPVSPTSASG
jgi:hypothetical protein